MTTAQKPSKTALYEAALDYHKAPNGAGKIAIMPTKALATQYDLSLAYSPGVAAPCEEIAKNPDAARDYTARGNLVAVITNGTAVLGLGDIGPLASKPVMEGKAVLFKKFSGLDAIDLEIDEKDPDKLIEIIASLEPSFGGINLEDIKAPECFYIERELKKRMKIPVFHDDQHGTAIIVGAAFTNWLRLSKRDIKKVKLVSSGAGASALAVLNLLVSLGLPKKNIIVTDKNGVVYKGRREGMDPDKAQFAAETNFRTLGEAIKNADIFLGLSAPRVMTKEMVKSMAEAPLLLTLANPTPEIMPEEARAASPSAVICTGRSDYPNQVNNALCFPFIFRGALDVGATTINEAMKLACVKAIADLTLAEVTAEVASLYSDSSLTFGADYLIPKPFDPRLILELPIAVAKAAMASGVATRPIKDFKAYRQELERYVYKSGQLMRPIMARASADVKRIAYAEGEEIKTLRAIQTIVDQKLALPVLVGREDVIMARIKKLGLRLKKERDFEIVNPDNDKRYNDYWQSYHERMCRKGTSPATAKYVVRTNNSVIAALLVEKGDADGMIAGITGRYWRHLKHVGDIIGCDNPSNSFSSLAVVIHPKGTLFITDAYVNANPSAEQLTDATLMAAEEVQRFGIAPKVALLSHSNFGTHENESASKMRLAYKLIKARAPELEIDGEMTAELALNEEVRKIIFPSTTLEGSANLLVMPNADAANIALNLLKVLDDVIVVGPILLGARKSAHILNASVTPRGIVNATAVAAVHAQWLCEEKTPPLKAKSGKPKKAQATKGVKQKQKIVKTKSKRK
jgi:malate dehydrogenase (oxaloacetate-decarboxylating)(NADP+)